MKRTLNDVYENLVFKALNPYGKQFMVPRQLPKELNPYLEPYGIRITALITFTIFPHIKTVPVVRMMLDDFDKGLYEGKHTIVVPSSGNTAHAVTRIARAFGFRKTKVVMSTDVSDVKAGILKALASADVIQVNDVAGTAVEEAQKPGHYLLDQYSHMGNIRAHETFTGPEVLRVLGSRVAVVAAAMGSGGTAAGIGCFFRKRYEEGNPETVIIGVRPTLGEQVPGARDSKKMADVVTLPWKDSVDVVFEVGRKEAFIRMKRLWSAVEPQPGPTSGLAWGGLEKYLVACNQEGLESLRGKTVGFICPDDGRFYSERTTGELDPDQGL
ncbi:MAG: pyridoxal-phosphate dependent enzyme [bacterium]|nr:pyridoxal-phosphate dependent enzyme [bacterium]